MPRLPVMAPWRWGSVEIFHRPSFRRPTAAKLCWWVVWCPSEPVTWLTSIRRGAGGVFLTPKKITSELLWLVLTGTMEFYDFPYIYIYYIGNNHPNWLSHFSEEGYYFLIFFRGRFWIFWGVPGSIYAFQFLWFSASLLFCFSAFPASLLFCFSAFPASRLFCFLLSLLLCFSCFYAFPASRLFCFLLSLLLCFSWFSAFLLFCFLLFLLLCFSASLFSLLLCFCTSVPFYFYYSTFSFLQSCLFAALLPAPLLLSFLSLLSLCFAFSFDLFCSVCILNETLERP